MSVRIIQLPKGLKNGWDSQTVILSRVGGLNSLFNREAIADNALLPLSVAELKTVYDYYNQLEQRWGDVTSVIMSEISTVCGQNKDLKPFLRWGGRMSETNCDIRVSHLVGGSGRFVANLEKAFVECLIALVVPALKPLYPLCFEMILLHHIFLQFRLNLPLSISLRVKFAVFYHIVFIKVIPYD